MAIGLNQSQAESRKRIETLRKKRVLLHRDVAKGIGMSETLYSMKLNGFRDFTMVDFLKLAAFFDVSVEYLTAM